MNLISRQIFSNVVEAYDNIIRNEIYSSVKDTVRVSVCKAVADSIHRSGYVRAWRPVSDELKEYKFK